MQNIKQCSTAGTVDWGLAERKEDRICASNCCLEAGIVPIVL